MSVNLETLKVSIEATARPFKKVIEETKKDAKDMASSVNKDIDRIKSPFSAIAGDSSGTMGKIRNMQKAIKDIFSNYWSGHGDGDTSFGSGIKQYVKDAQIAAGIKQPTEEYTQLEASIEKANNALGRLRDKEKKMVEMGITNKPSMEYKALEKEIESASDALGKLQERKQDMLDAGAPENSGGIKVMEQDIQKAEAAIEELRQKKEQMNADGLNGESQAWKSLQYDIRAAEQNLKAYQASKTQMQASGTDTQFANQGALSSGSAIQAAGATASAALSGMRAKLGEVRASVNGAIKKIPFIGRVATEAAYTGSKAFGGLCSAMQKVGPAIKKAGGFFGSLIQKFKSGIPILNRTGKSMRGVGNSSKGLGNSIFKLGNMFKLMLVRMAMRSVINGAKEGFQNLAQYSSSANASLSMLMSSMTQLKNSFAAAFAPILNVVAPILNSFIQKIISVVNAIGQLMGALTGQGSYVRAKKVNQDYAASLDNASDNLKDNAKDADNANKSNQKLQRTLMGFDQINKLDDSSDSNSGSGAGAGSTGAGGLSPGDMFETVPIESKFKDLASKIKDIFSKIFDPMKKAWDAEGKNVIAAFQYAVGSVKTLAEEIGKTFLDVWTNGTGERFCRNILILLADILNWIGDIATAWTAAWENKGENYVQSIFDKLNAILELIHTISESFRNAWNSGSGQEIIEHIFQILTDINQTITYITQNFNKAWKNSGGDKIAQLILDILNIILGTIEKITTSTKNWAKNLDFAPIVSSVKNLLEKVKPLVQTIGDALAWVWENVALPLGKWLMESAIPKIVDAIAAAFEALNDIFVALKPLFDWIWEHALKPLASWTGGTIIEIIEGITSVFKGIGEVFKKISDGEDWGSIGKYIWEGLIGGITGLLSWVWEKLKGIFNGIVQFVKDIFGIKSPSTVFSEIGGFLMSGLEGGLGDKVGSVLSWFGKLGGKVKNALGNAKDWLVQKGKDAIEGIKNGWDAVKESKLGKTVSKIGGFVKEKVGNIANTVKEKGTNIINGIKDGYEKSKTSGLLSDVSKLKDNVFSSIGAVKDKVTSKGKDIIEGVKKGYDQLKSGGLLEKVKTLKNDIFTAIGAVKEKVVSKGKDIISGLKTGFDNNKSLLTNAVSDIPSLIKNGMGDLYTVGRNAMQSFADGFKSVYVPTPHIGVASYSSHSVGTSSFNTPNFRVSWYAAGGFPGAGEMFVARENGPELVGRMGSRNAVANNSQIVDGISAGVYPAVYDAVRDAMQGNGNTGSTGAPIVEVTITCDSETLYHKTEKGKEKSNRRFNVTAEI